MKRCQLVLPLFLLASLWMADSASAQSNGVLREVWLNLTGTAVADLTNSSSFPNNPSFDGVLTNGFESPTNVYDNYGQRLRALLLPRITGTYYFLIASDDNSQFFLSTNDTPGGKRLIARVDGWTDPRLYHNQPVQKSAAVSLAAGQRYYLEALMKEGGGGDNLAVTWQKPGDAEPADGSAPIPNTNLLAYGLGPPVFTVHPRNASVVENGTTNFSAQLSRSLGASLQWVRNGTNIPGATSATWTLGPLRLADSGSTLYCRATNSYGATNSNTAILTVTADTTRPTISYAQSFGESTLVTVGFSEPVDRVSAGNLVNFFLNNGVDVLGATLLDDGSTVLLRTTPLAWGNTYTLTVSNVRDLAQTPNSILPNSQRVFSVSYTPLPITYVLGTNEPAGPSSRRTGLAISEIMYHPAGRADGRNLEFIEIYNSNPWAEDLSGHRISGDVGYSFPAGTTIPALGYRVVAANPSDVQSVYGLTNVLGPLTNSTPGNTTNVFDNGGATIRLRDELNAVLLEVTYDDQPPWPAAADGAGHSLVLARPSYGEDDPRAWAASDRVGGSPGAYDTYTPVATRSVLINEILAHTDPPQEDSIELFNYSSAAVDLSGCGLSDDPTTNKFRLAAGTSIPARGFLAFTGTQLGFRLNAAGETVYLVAADGSRVLNAVRFSAQENGVAFGRFPDGAPSFRRLSSVTLGTNNAPPMLSDVVINEVQYHPASNDDDEEFVEIHNRGTNALALAKWRLSGGVSYTFPAGTSLPAGGYLVVARDSTTLLAAHPGLSAAAVLGGYSGKLGNRGDVVRLDQPHDLLTTNEFAQLVTNKIHIVVDEVTYGTGGRWGHWSDGDGSSLERTDPRSDGDLAPNWADSDEAAKSGWTMVEFTGLLDNGAMAGADQLQLFLLGAGECLVDNVEVIPKGGTNVVANGTFDAGTVGWFFQGTHEQSAWQASGGFSGGCLHVVASDRGDTGANRIRTVLTRTLVGGSTATLRAKVRWLKGHPEILLRLHGNWLEAAGNTLTSRDLGSPGGCNTRFRTNAGPAITGVRHWPVLPAAGQAVTVTAQIEDPDGIAQTVLKYRVDPASNYVTVPMNYCGAGFFSGVIPGQASGARTAFYLEARDAFTPNATSRFPDDAPTRECLVGFGETTPAGSFGAYRLWVSRKNVTRWATREKQSNTPLDATFVYGGARVCYNVGVLYSGSPFHTPGYNSPDGNACDYEMSFAKDDQLLGTGDFVLATIGNLNSDATYQAEQTAFWISRKLGAPYLHRRYIRLFFNGQPRSVVYEDAQQPNADVVSEFFPDDDAGSLHKIEDWFEFDDTGDSMLGNVDATLQNFTTTGSAKKTARYRWNWRPRGGHEAATAFTNLFALVDAMNAAQPEPYRSGAAGLVNVEEFMRVLAMERIVGNWDSYGYARGKNMFAYKPTQAPWMLLPWDVDFVFSAGGNSTTDPLFGSNEPVLDALRAFPEFQRAYWRAFEDAVNGPLQATTLAARLDSHYNALVAAGVGPGSPQSLKNYAAQRRTFIVTQLATVAAPFSVSPTVTVSNGLGVISGTAPVNVGTVAVNGAAWTVRWTTVSNWVATVPLQTGSNFFAVVGLDVNGQAISGASNNVSRAYDVAVPSPVDTVVINEVMYDPLLPDAEYVELFNTSTTSAFDVSGWSFNGLSYTFPNGTSIGPRGFLLLAKSRAAFSLAYGPTIDVFDEFGGNLQSDGETLSLLKPGAPPGTAIVVDRVRYEAASPWPAAVPGTSLQLRDPAQDNSRVANWVVGDVSVALATPGATNSVFATLIAFPSLWLNEAQADNVFGPFDNAGQREPWIELFNPGTNALSLGGYFLSDSYTNLGKWAFPSNVTVPASGFTLVWCDAQTNQAATNALHSSFRLTSGAGKVAVSRLVSNKVQLVDYLTYTNLPSNWSYGDIPDAQPFYRGAMFRTTPAGTNDGAAPPLTVSINEWMADNTGTLTDPADNDFEDWFEIYNPGTNTVDLGGYYLTDNLTNKFQFLVPNNDHYLIPPGGFLLVWADNETGQNNTNRADLHASFALSKGGEAIGIFAEDGTQIDAVTFGAQTSDVSQGRFPDGSANIMSLVIPTPRAANVLPNTPPILAAINDAELVIGQSLVFTAAASDTNMPAQTLAFALGAGAPVGASIDSVSGQFRWTPSVAPGTNAISVIVTDSGTPSLTATQTFHVMVYTIPSIGVSFPGGQLQLSWPFGTLQEADEATGPYCDLTDVSPFSPPMTAVRRFYRIRF